MKGAGALWNPIRVIVSLFNRVLVSGIEVSNPETKLWYWKRGTEVPNVRFNSKSETASNSKLKTKTWFWKRSFYFGNKASIPDIVKSKLQIWVLMISWKQSYDSENETLILETKLQIWVIIRSFPTQKKTLIWEMKLWSWKQNFKFELLLQVANKASNLNCNSRMETKLWYEKETSILETKLRSSKLNFEFVFQKKKYWKQNFQWEF